MALFKISKGTAANLSRSAATNTTHDGFAYFTIDDGKFYIDIKDNETPQIGINRIPLNANTADRAYVADAANTITTDLYWANVLVNTESNISTTPTFGSVIIGDQQSGIYLRDSANISYEALWDNGSNLWIGAKGSNYTGHVGKLYLHAGINNNTDKYVNQSVYLGVGANANTTTTSLKKIVYKTNDENAVGSSIQPVYAKATGELAPISYTVNANVPDDAKFTDTWVALNTSVPGYVPIKAPDDNNQFLDGKATWSKPKFTIDTNHTIEAGDNVTSTNLKSWLGLTNAVHFIGQANVALTDGGIEDPNINGYDFDTDRQPGDIILGKDGDKEYIWGYNGWELLGPVDTIQAGVATGIQNRIAYYSANNMIAAANYHIYSSQGYTINANTNSSSYFKAVNNNGAVSLYAATNRGLYDATNGKWIVQLTQDSNNTYIPNWKNIGANNKFVYFNNSGEPVATNATIGGTVKLWYLNAGVATNSTGSKGAGNNPVYLSNGTITASAANIGSTYKPVWMDKGVIKSISDNSVKVNLASTSAANTYQASPRLGVEGILRTANGGTGNNTYTANTLIYATNTATELTSYTSTKGGTTKLWYLNAGVPTDSVANVGSAETITYLSSGTITTGQKAWVLSGGTAFAANESLNDKTTYGNYYINNTRIAYTLLNTPYNAAAGNIMSDGFLKVQSSLGSSSAWLRQDFYRYDRPDHFVRFKNNSSNWSGWQTYVYKASDGATTGGGAEQPVYVNAVGAITNTSYYLKANVSNATQWGIAYYSAARTITSTGQGTNNYVLTASGAAAPKWTAQSSLSGVAAAKTTTLAWSTTSTIATIGGNDIKVTMPANPNTDAKVTQGTTTTSNWRKVLLNGGSSNTYSAWNTDIVEATGVIYQSKSIAVQPSSGTLAATHLQSNGYLTIDRTDYTYDASLAGENIALIRMKYRNTGSGIYDRYILSAIKTSEASGTTDASTILLASGGGNLILSAGENNTSGGFFKKNGIFKYASEGLLLTSDGYVDMFTGCGNAGNESTEGVFAARTRISNIGIQAYYPQANFNRNLQPTAVVEKGMFLYSFATNAATNADTNTFVGGTYYHIEKTTGNRIYYAATMYNTDAAFKSLSLRMPYDQTSSYLTWTDGYIGNRIIPWSNNSYGLGSSTYKWKEVYATTFYGALSGNATSADKVNKTLTITLNGTNKTFNGSADTSMTIYAPTTAGTSGYILKSNGSGAPTWLQTLPVENGGTGKKQWTANSIIYASAANTLAQISHASNTSYVLKSGSSSTAPSWIQYTKSNTASTIVQRDAGGNFSAGTITATLSGNASTATSASKLQNTSKIGDTNLPVYFTASGVPTPIKYTIDANVPSGAKFTDTNTKVNVVSNTSKAYVLGTTTTPPASATAVTAVAHANVYTQSGVLHGACWNDYAEFRCSENNIQIKPGRVVIETGHDSLRLVNERLQRGCQIVSDTYGFAIGENEKNQLPLAVSGRVLAYPYESTEEFRKHVGWPVCSGPNGTVSIMTEEEEMKYPSRIIGIISAIPDYTIWRGEKDIKVDGRVWIKVR